MEPGEGLVAGWVPGADPLLIPRPGPSAPEEGVWGEPVRRGVGRGVELSFTGREESTVRNRDSDFASDI